LWFGTTTRVPIAGEWLVGQLKLASGVRSKPTLKKRKALLGVWTAFVSHQIYFNTIQNNYEMNPGLASAIARLGAKRLAADQG
jgi:hypothetical protein